MPYFFYFIFKLHKLLPDRQEIVNIDLFYFRQIISLHQTFSSNDEEDRSTTKNMNDDN